MMQTLEGNRVVQKMLDRLFAALVNGPSLNARPHSSRQRIDFTQFGKLKDRALEDILRDLLGEPREARVIARVPPVKRAGEERGDDEGTLSPEEQAARQAWSDQQAVLGKCRGIVEDARVYENDTGVHVLQIGFPILSLPPGSFGARNLTRRVLAPLAFISLSMNVRSGAQPAIHLECRNDGADLVTPNIALLAWLENQAGRPIGELDADEHGERPWDEIAHIVQRVSGILELPTPEVFASGEQVQSSLALRPCPRADDEDTGPRIVSSAVVGLFPLANEGLIRDTQALLAGEPVEGPIEHFVDASVRLDGSQDQGAPDAPQDGVAGGSAYAVEKRTRDFAAERLIAPADPCQARAVMLARESRGLVVHGPPGTGKSQTIANIIGDHLGRGERVLFVCDKRTALDVVMNRLESMGLSSLCAIVHDPQRDQRELYRAVRDQLDSLAELPIDAAAEKRIGRLDRELQKLHEKLTEYHTALMHRPTSADASFHEMMGQWFELASHTVDVDLKPESLSGIAPADLDARGQELEELFDRGLACEFYTNPWEPAAGIPLGDFLATPMDRIRSVLQDCLEKAAVLDATASELIPPFGQHGSLTEMARGRATLADRLKVWVAGDLAFLRKWASAAPDRVKRAAQQLEGVAAHVERIRQGPLDLQLSAALGAGVPPISTVNQEMVALEAYLAASSSFLGFLAFRKKKVAGQILAPYGLSLSRANAERVHRFLSGLRDRLLVDEVVRQVLDVQAGASEPGTLPDDALVGHVQQHREILELLGGVAEGPEPDTLRALLAAGAESAEKLGALVEGLERSSARAAAISELETRLQNASLFSDRWLSAMSERVRSGDRAGETLAGLHGRLDSLENVLRVSESLAGLPALLREACEQLLKASVEREPALTVLRRATLSLAITARLRSDNRLQTSDHHTLQTSFDRYLALDQEKKVVARNLILGLWAGRQKARLVAGTGTRLNGAGADLRRRFVLRGERAMRLRQVIAVGQSLPDEDPLFDLRPVWMASPETVAQIFPRKPLFDVVVFDEASQCRLEEALPVLLRARRVVIAGDPRQLPPTRFFESAVAASDQDEITTDQQLFEVQQGEIEDLLGAALNIEIEECYLDVHYRSRNADLIEFSNQHFYGSRLQPIPGHPSNRSRFAPLTLYRADGIYKDRQNEVEAEKVCQIVRDLLRRATPPSIGIACFNIAQRDLILDKLDEAAEADRDFARQLAEARTLRRGGQFSGLFVKNLENVQGDERDHIIISTTYGPDPSGRFYRRFGPLGSSGGGRRLNVLVTRARDEVHLVTSIPPSLYRQLPPIPPGTAPGGAWLLFSYLAYAERLQELYEEAHGLLEAAQSDHRALLNVRHTRYPSSFCQTLGSQLVERHGTGTDVYWGNDGFCVDLALRHPERINDVTIGVLCDTNRFGLAADPVEWEIFRTTMLESQGWRLHRLWTPHFFRDIRGSMDQILKEMRDFLATDTETDALQVNQDGELPR